MRNRWSVNVMAGLALPDSHIAIIELRQQGLQLCFDIVILVWWSGTRHHVAGEPEAFDHRLQRSMPCSMTTGPGLP